ncbi:FIST N-terminal domain-containing protein [Paracoccus sp. NSM]|uniref:FIST N-terminal domain-containing protein n=1 Tax=Paracoccus sp. NSM TaxID=3457784 RepID=UPI0040362BFA
MAEARHDLMAEHGGQDAAQQDAPIRASVPAGMADPAGALAARLGAGPHALIVLFAGEGAVLPQVLAGLTTRYPRTEILGCTTAGEIGEDGYAEGHLVAIAFPASSFAVETVVIDPLSAIDSRRMVARLQQARLDLSRHADRLRHELALLLVDGVSGEEEFLIASLSGGLGPMPIVGGSAGDGHNFNRTQVFRGERVHDHAAIVCMIRSKMVMRTFSFDSTMPSRRQMVVTQADPARRIILRINDEPAAAEYARLLDCPPDNLGPELFATRPVLVRVGGRHFVRAIRDVGPGQSLVFFGAVAEGMVLTLSAETDIAAHLERALDGLSRDGPPSLILGFDCVFRRIEVETRQRVAEVSGLLARHRVAGFSTYGEQVNGMHLNQTLTGVAFYPDGAGWG